MRTQRILGELIKAGQDRGEIAGQGDRVSNVPERSAFQQIAEERKVSVLNYSVDVTSPATIVGQRIIYITEYSDGTQVIHRERFISKKQSTIDLPSIWLDHQNLTFDLFVFYCSRAHHAGKLIIHDGEWSGHGWTVMEAYSFLSSHGFVKENLKTTEVLKAFSGSFVLPRIKNVRSLQDRKRNTVEEREFNKRRNRFRQALENLFEFAVRKIDNERTRYVI